ncbi:hypothetical protein B0H14DRAFT_3520900 [Mycena olivaceomarginata]|nr:hypothetical protein B0H14DRAFT_3520900 [Mycena olivaceomarginata]
MATPYKTPAQISRTGAKLGKGKKSTADQASGRKVGNPRKFKGERLKFLETQMPLYLAQKGHNSVTEWYKNMFPLWWVQFPWYKGYGPDGKPLPEGDTTSAPPDASTSSATADATSALPSAPTLSTSPATENTTSAPPGAPTSSVTTVNTFAKKVGRGPEVLREVFGHLPRVMWGIRRPFRRLLGAIKMHQTIIFRAPLQPSAVRITAVTNVTPDFLPPPPPPARVLACTALGMASIDWTTDRFHFGI